MCAHAGDMEFSYIYLINLKVIIAQRTALLAIHHPHYDILAGAVELSTINRYTPDKFSDACNQMGLGCE